MASFNFTQIKLNANENITNAVLNRALIRLYKNIEDIRTSSDLQLPEITAQQNAFLVSQYNESSSDRTVTWKTFDEIQSSFIKPKLVELDGMTSASPVKGQTISWDPASGSNGLWVYQDIPTKINHLANFSQVIDKPDDQMVMTYSASKESWIASNPTKFIGVGYIYHKVVEKPTIIRLPDTSAALEGGEQVVITKLIPPGDKANKKFPVLITSGVGILNQSSIISNNDDETFASIHLRACSYNGRYIWVPVCATGSWRPTSKYNLDKSDLGSNQTVGNVEIYQLEANEIKLQPYDIDISFSTNDGDISKNYKVNLIKSSTGNWTISTVDANLTGINFNSDDGLITVSHNILSGLKATKATVYFKDGNKLTQIIPDEVYFNYNGSTQTFGTTCIAIGSWLELNLNSLEFLIVISV